MTNADRPPGTILLADGPVSSLDAYLEGGGGALTDIVRSTEKAAELGDREWAGLLQEHHTTVRRVLARYRGTEVDTAGRLLRHVRRTGARDPMRSGDPRGDHPARP